MYAKNGITEEALKQKIDDAGGMYEVAWQEQVQKDIKTVYFDCENVTDPDDEEGFAMPGFIHGYDVLPNGVPVCWVGAGGDWECPVAMCIFVGEDDKFHAYVPEDGNVYNKGYGAAYGNNGDEEEYESQTFDMDSLRDDASDHVIFK